MSSKIVKSFLFGSLPESTSPAGTLDALDFKKAARHLVVAVVGALVTVVFDFLSRWLTGTDFGQYQMLVGFVVSSGIVEVARRWVSAHIPLE